MRNIIAPAAAGAGYLSQRNALRRAGT